MHDKGQATGATDGQRPASAARGRVKAAKLVGGAAMTVATLLAARAIASRPDGRDGASNGTYPPLDTLKPVADGVWVVDSGPLRPLGVPVPLRMTVLRLGNGDLLLHSPTRHTAELARGLEAIGPVRHLIAPNGAHWMYVREWQDAYPDAITWAAPGLRDRAQVRRSGIRFDHDLGDQAPDAWAREIGQGVVPAALGFREVYLFHRATRTLVLTDLIENLDPARVAPYAGLLMRLAGGADGKPARHLRAVLRLGGAESAAAVRKLVELAPERVVFSHGRWFEERGAERLARAFRRLT